LKVLREASAVLLTVRGAMLVLHTQNALAQVVVLVDGTETVDHFGHVLGTRDWAPSCDDAVGAGVICVG
jgi:hypothetical protein